MLPDQDLAVRGRHQEHIALLNSSRPQNLDGDGDAEAVAHFDYLHLKFDRHVSVLDSQGLHLNHYREPIAVPVRSARENAQ